MSYEEIKVKIIFPNLKENEQNAVMFELLAHKRDQNDFQLDHQEFYKKRANTIPSDGHIEIEVVNHETLRKQNKTSNKLLDDNWNLIDIHLHKWKDDKEYACLTTETKETQLHNTIEFRTLYTATQIILWLQYNSLNEIQQQKLGNVDASFIKTDMWAEIIF